MLGPDNPLPRWLRSVAAVIALTVGGASIQATPPRETAIASPRLSSLRQALARHDSVTPDPPPNLADNLALKGFWEEIRHDGSPLIEATTAAHERLVTFLWRSEADTHVVLLSDFGDYVPHMTLERLPDTDVWYRSLRMPDDARFLYEFAVDDPAYPFVDGDNAQYPSSPRPDPLNPHRWEYAKPHILSLVELPNAPSLELSTPDPKVTHGVVGRFGQLLHSTRLGNDRKIFFYRPAGYSDSAEPYPLLLFGASYINQIHLPVILDNLIARHRIPPVVAIFIDYPADAQDEEMGGGDAYGDFIATELLPWVRQRMHVTTDPHRVVIGGASAAGHSAACVGLQHPEVIGNVIAQSGAFWRGIGHTAAYWGDPSRDAGREGFARAVASHPTVPVRYYLTIGLLERGQAFSADAVSMLGSSRHVSSVLRAKGYNVTLREIAGGHDPYNWEATLPDALVTILNQPSTSKP